MKILVVGDQHFRFEHSYASAIPDGRRSEWEAVKKTIHDAAKNCDVIVLMGDNLNARHNHSSVIREFIEFLKEFGDKPIHMLVGNHERFGEHTALDFLKKVNHPNWNIYSTITENVMLGDKIATFIPFCTPAMLEVATKEEAETIINNLRGVDIMFAHHAITGTEGTEFFNEVMIDKSKLKHEMTFGGHVHKPERLSNTVIVTGNIFTQEVGEHDKCVWVWDSLTNTTLEVPLPVRGIYKVGVEKTYNTFIHIPDNSIVKCFITSRDLDVNVVRKDLERFDAGIIIEQYPSSRPKVHFESGGLDLSVENLLKLYAENKGLPYNELKEGFELIK